MLSGTYFEKSVHMTRLHSTTSKKRAVFKWEFITSDNHRLYI